jgi:hypothetical protein
MKIAMFVVLGIVLLMSLFVVFLPSERSYSKTEIINANVDKVFAIVTNLEAQTWRTDNPSIQILDKTSGSEVWIEKPKHGPEIKFRTKTKQAPNLFVIEIIDNSQFGGTWTGKFSSTSDGKTRIEFTESVSLNGFVSKLFSYMFFYIEKTVEQDVADLKAEAEKP